MAWYDFQNMTAFDPYTKEGEPNAVGAVYAATDTAFATPLVVTLMGSGTTTDTLETDSYCQMPGFQVENRTQVVFRSGTFTKVLNTTTPLVGPAGPAIAEAVDNGDNTVTFKLEDGTDAATVPLPPSTVPGPPGPEGPKGRDGSNVLPTAEAIRQEITTPGSPANTALTATIAEGVAPKLDKVSAAATYAPLTALPRTVRHGGNAGTARTTTGQITWVGWVQPSNMETQDVWLEIAEPPFTIKDSIGWEAFYYANDLTVANGATVPVWADSSGNGYDLTPATSIGAGTPTFKAAAAEFNGKPAVAFNASAMWSQTLASPIAQPFTVVAVARGLTNPSGIFGGPAILYRASAAPGNYTFNAGGGAREITGSAGTDLKFLMVEFNGASSTAKVNTLTALSGTATATASALTQIKVGGHDAGASKQAEIALLGVHRGLLSSKQRTDLFAWITAQYGVAL